VTVIAASARLPVLPATLIASLVCRRKITSSGVTFCNTENTLHVTIIIMTGVTGLTLGYAARDKEVQYSNPAMRIFL
jgi:hypothetical protein